MELVTFAKEVVQNVAERAASYRVGQSALRHLDRALWVVEKCARWAVPPPLDQDERPQPELVRPLPWLLFLALLVTLRVARESVSLVNLVLGKPPLRSADVVMYIQSKRRYLRTLKYQGNRMKRARAAPSHEPWYSKLQSLFEFTMCFRRQSRYGNNNTTTLSNNDEVMVVKRSKRGRETSSPVASTSEVNLERLIEKMMVDLDADSEDDSSFTLTNATSLRSDRSEVSDSDHDTLQNEEQNPKNDSQLEAVNVENNVSPTKSDVSPTKSDVSPTKSDVSPTKSDVSPTETDVSPTKTDVSPTKSDVNTPTTEKTGANCKPAKEMNNEEEIIKENERQRENGDHNKNDQNQTLNETPVKDKSSLSEPSNTENKQPNISSEDLALQHSKIPKMTFKDELQNISPTEESKRFLEAEICSPQRNQQTRNTKIGRKIALAFSKTFHKREIEEGQQTQRRVTAVSDARPSSDD